jgi:hypothetical protein
MSNVLHSETPVEYFKEVVEKVMSRQGFQSSELSAFYLVQLLDDFVAPNRCYSRADVEIDATVAELLCGAIASHGDRRFARFKLTGDVALFVSGFFSDSMAKRNVELDYYMRMGGYAYGSAAQLSPNDAAEVFHELSAKFGRFVDVLNEVSEEASLTDVAGILRLYERWLQTGSKRSEKRLRQEGIVLGSSADRIH